MFQHLIELCSRDNTAGVGCCWCGQGVTVMIAVVVAEHVPIAPITVIVVVDAGAEL